MFAGKVFPVDFKGEGFCLDKEGEGVLGRGTHVHVKARVIDGEFGERGFGGLKRRAACGEPQMSPAASPEGIRTAPCSGGLTYGRAPHHCSMQAHMCPSACLLTPEHPASPTLCWGQGPAGDSGLSSAQSRDRTAKPKGGSWK